MGSCSGCSAFSSDVEPDIDEKKFKRHVRETLISSLDSEDYPIHLCVIEKNINKLKKQLKQNRDKLNILDHHGYTPLHLAVLLRWNKGIDLLLSYYASPIISSHSGWTPMEEAISTKQFIITQKLANALSNNFSEYSKQNVTKIYDNLTQKTDFYIELKLESFAKVLESFTDHYFPSDTLKIWKKNGSVRVDMTLLDYDYDKKQWLRGNISNIFIIKKTGSFDFYYIDHNEQSIDLKPNMTLLNFDNIHFDISNKTKINTEIKKLSLKPVKSRRIQIQKAQFKRQKSWIGTVEEEIIDDIKCSIYKCSDIQFVSKYRNQHIPPNKRKHIKNDSSIVSLIISGDNEEEENDDNDDYKDNDIDDIKCDYIAPEITMSNYEKLTGGDTEIRNNAIRNKIKFDSDESFIINTVETNVSETSYNLSIYMTDSYGIDVKEILVIFDLIGIKTNHMNNVKKILQLTAYDESRFPLSLEMPLLLNVVRARLTFQNLKREPIQSEIFKIPQYKR